MACYVATMAWDVGRTYRQVAAALGLLGVLFYAALLPGHLTSQFAEQLFAAEYGSLGQVVCRGAQAVPTQPGAPASPAPSCPFCKGLAAFQFALSPAPVAIVPAIAERALLCAVTREDIADGVLLTPRSRGPPSQA